MKTQAEIGELGYLHSSNWQEQADQHVKDTYQHWYRRLADSAVPSTDWSHEDLVNYAFG